MRRSLRAYLPTLLITGLGLVLLPFLALLPKGEAEEKEILPSEPSKAAFQGEGFLVLDEADGKVQQMSDYQYVLGSVLSEMPASYGEEALKAQAVASHTYAMLLRSTARAGSEKPKGGADFTVDSSRCYGYMDPADAEKYLGRDYERLLAKVEEAVSEVIGEALYYEDKLISACYHAISPGMTEDSGNVFEVSLPYLSAVPSEWDKDAKGYESEVELEAYTLDSMLKLYDPSYISSGSPVTWLGEIQKSPSGTVLSVDFCGKAWHGTKIREALGLRSAAFDVKFDSDKGFVFNVYGYGHGVGLSQVGAGYMAKEGSTYKEILSHYYPTSELKPIQE